MLANEDKNGHDIEHWRMMMIILIMITRITRTEYWNTSHETLLMSHNIHITPILQGFTIRKYRVFFIDCDTGFDYKTFKNYFLMLVLVLK